MPKNEKKWTWLNKTCIHKAIISLWFFLGSESRCQKSKRRSRMELNPSVFPRSTWIRCWLQRFHLLGRDRSILIVWQQPFPFSECNSEFRGHQWLKNQGQKECKKSKLNRVTADCCSDDRLVVIRNHTDTRPRRLGIPILRFRGPNMSTPRHVYQRFRWIPKVFWIFGCMTHGISWALPSGKLT